MSRGHSLLELLAALAILVLVAGALVLTLRSSGERELREARRELSRTLAAGRDLARAEGRPEVLTLRLDGSGWWLEDEANPGWRGFTGSLPHGVRFRRAWLRPGEDIRSGPVRLTVSPEATHTGLILEVQIRGGELHTWGLPRGSWEFAERSPECDPELADWFRRWTS